MHGYTEVLFVSALFVHMGYIKQPMVICAVRIFALFLLLYLSARKWLHPSAQEGHYLSNYHSYYCLASSI